ncbi:uncharacterized protein LODBEIA_P14170 [Lodderomyces beijingensis]|uniref:Uncharacterized protein n=1 Tax=Lodderomyces beijingensis TaxID=1775926 RepID=A0ABP0ZG96_9ASCO
MEAHTLGPVTHFTPMMMNPLQPSAGFTHFPPAPTPKPPPPPPKPPSQAMQSTSTANNFSYDSKRISQSSFLTPATIAQFATLPNNFFSNHQSKRVKPMRYERRKLRMPRAIEDDEGKHDFGTVLLDVIEYYLAPDSAVPELQQQLQQEKLLELEASSSSEEPEMAHVTRVERLGNVTTVNDGSGELKMAVVSNQVEKKYSQLVQNFNEMQQTRHESSMGNGHKSFSSSEIKHAIAADEGHEETKSVSSTTDDTASSSTTFNMGTSSPTKRHKKSKWSKLNKLRTSFTEKLKYDVEMNAKYDPDFNILHHATAVADATTAEPDPEPEPAPAPAPAHPHQQAQTATIPTTAFTFSSASPHDEDQNDEIVLDINEFRGRKIKSKSATLPTPKPRPKSKTTTTKRRVRIHEQMNTYIYPSANLVLDSGASATSELSSSSRSSRARNLAPVASMDYANLNNNSDGDGDGDGDDDDDDDGGGGLEMHQYPRVRGRVQSSRTMAHGFMGFRREFSKKFGLFKKEL